MSEKIISSERLASMVKAGSVENRSRSGYTPRGDQRAMDILYRTRTDKRLELSGSGWSVPPEGFTHVGLAPIKGFTDPRETDVVAGFNPNDVAVCIAYHGVNVDRSHRKGTMRAVVVMSKEDAALFVEGVKTSPGLVYSLLRHVNGGPVEREDGTPMDIRPGEAVRILANNMVGGDINETVESRPFSPSFSPNPLL